MSVKSMSLFDPTIDSGFREYTDLQLHRHELLLDGKENAPETTEIEDRMDRLWHGFDEIQHRSLNGMGSDLNWIRRKGEPPPNGRKTPEEVPVLDMQELVAANALKDWHGFLHYLRVCAPKIPRVNLAYWRAIAYDAIGFPAYSSAFYEQAAEFDPANASMGVIALQYIHRVNSPKAVRRAESIIASHVPFPPVVLALSAVMVLRRDEAEGRVIDRQRFSALLKESIERLQLELPSEAIRAMVYQLAASGFEIIDDLPSALGCYEKGLAILPNSDVLLIGIGLLLYGSRTNQAVEALEKAAQLSTPLVWPYFFLTHHYLFNEKYNQSLEAGREASLRATTNPIRAQLFEWRAICLSELHFPVEKVRPLFEKAALLDPSNPLIAKNVAAFDQALADAQKPEWGIEDPSRLRTQRIESLRELELIGVP